MILVTNIEWLGKVAAIDVVNFIATHSAIYEKLISKSS